MGREVPDADAARDIAEPYAAEECVGTLGEVREVTREDDVWVVEFETHTFSDVFRHRIRITGSVGNVISHEREKRD